MGRKSSAKAQSQASSAPPPNDPPRGLNPALVMVIVLALVVGGVLAYSKLGGTPEPAAAPVQQAQATIDPPQFAKFGPHKQDNLPPLPFNLETPVRPIPVVTEAYKFAAEHPEVLSYVPCYCGCERSGHHGNDDCFVSARAPNGDVTEWEPHGMT